MSRLSSNEGIPTVRVLHTELFPDRPKHEDGTYHARYCKCDECKKYYEED